MSIGPGFVDVGTEVSTAAPIFNSFASPELDVIALTDPEQIRLYREQIANQMNDQSKATGGTQCLDLSKRIADIRLETTAQGASILEVDVIDPYLMMFARNDKGISFIDVADDGYIYPPINLNFPPDGHCTWRLCAVRPSLFEEQPTTLTFEDVGASILREVDPKIGGVNRSNPGETLGEWMKRLVDATNKAIQAKKVDAPKGFHIEVAMWIAPFPEDPNAPKSTGTHFNKKTHPSGPQKFAKELAARTTAAAHHSIKIIGDSFFLDPGAPPSTGTGNRQSG